MSTDTDTRRRSKGWDAMTCRSFEIFSTTRKRVALATTTRLRVVLTEFREVITFPFLNTRLG